MSTVFGVVFLILGFMLTVSVSIRLAVYWEGFGKAHRVLLLGVIVTMLGFVQRGIELLWFHAPGPRLFAVFSIVAACMWVYTFTHPVDSRLEPDAWKLQFQTEEPDNYDKYMEVLSQSAQARIEASKLDRKYRTTYEE